LKQEGWLEERKKSQWRMMQNLKKGNNKKNILQLTTTVVQNVE